MLAVFATTLTPPFIRRYSPSLEDLIGPHVLGKIAEQLFVFYQTGLLLVSPETRADLTKFLLTPVTKMPVRMPTQLDKEFTFLLFTFSELPENYRNHASWGGG
jgi:hypothetical protein